MFTARYALSPYIRETRLVLTARGNFKVMDLHVSQCFMSRISEVMVTMHEFIDAYFCFINYLIN